MPGAVIAFQLNVAGVAEVDRFFEVLDLRVTDLRGAWPATDAVFSEILGEQFATEGGRSGSPWKELSAVTREDRERKGFPPDHPILVRTGRLRDSFVDPRHGDAISEHGALRWARGSRAGYAGSHQTGSGDGRLPQRRIIDLTSEDRHRLLRPVRNWVTGNDPWAGQSLGAQLGRRLQGAA